MFDNFLIHTFHDGNCLQAYKIFGAHFETHEGKKGVRFTTYAPNARSAQVVGEFNQWGETPCYMERYNNGGIYTIFVEGVKEFDMYKFRFETPQGDIIDKADPYAYFSELRPGTASKVYNMEGYRWHDSKWIKNRTKNYDCPLNIYEASLGSWKMKRESEGEGDDGEYYSYEELIDEIIPYVKKMGYTHLEVMPLTEFPFDGSWGYQATGFYSATSRYGQPKQLMKFIDACHQEGIGVIMDFVPAHFVKDSHGLHMYDGGFVYDYNDYNRRYSPWDSVYFDLGKNEVRSFLLSSVEFFATYYHIDGFRFDAVSNLIYYEGNKNLGENIGAMEWMKRLNGHMSGYHPTVMMIAEDSTDYPGVTKPVGEHGLGFDYKWDLGWMNDTLEYFKIPPKERPNHYYKLTFSMEYFYNELFLLPFSHDEVVHGKATIIQKMWGDYDDKFKQCRALYMYMYTHPGKKLNFMGNEIAQFREWDEKREQDWQLIKMPLHDAFNKYIKRLNEVYDNYEALYENEYDSSYFKWLEVNAPEKSVYIYERGRDDHRIIVALNFSDNEYAPFTFKVEEELRLREIVNSDSDIYGGSTWGVRSDVTTTKEDDNLYNLSINLKPFSGIIYEVVNY